MLMQNIEKKELKTKTTGLHWGKHSLHDRPHDNNHWHCSTPKATKQINPVINNPTQCTVHSMHHTVRMLTWTTDHSACRVLHSTRGRVTQLVRPRLHLTPFPQFAMSTFTPQPD